MDATLLRRYREAIRGGEQADGGAVDLPSRRRYNALLRRWRRHPGVGRRDVAVVGGAYAVDRARRRTMRMVERGKLRHDETGESFSPDGVATGAAAPSVAVSADGLTVASGSDYRDVRVWDLRRGANKSLAHAMMDGNDDGDEVRAIALASSRRALPDLVASAHDDGSIKLWEANPLAARSLDADEASLDVAERRGTSAYHTFERAHGAFVANGLALSAAGTRLLSGGGDGTVRLWDVDFLRRRLTVFEGHRGSVNGVDASSDGRLCISGGDDKTVRAWDPRARGGAVLTLEVAGSRDRKAGEVCGVALAADDGTLASAERSGNDDGGVRIWDLRRADAPRHSLGLGKMQSVVVALSADGRLAASGHRPLVLPRAAASRPEPLRLWDAASGALLERVSQMHEAPSGVAMSDDGGTLACVGTSPSGAYRTGFDDLNYVQVWRNET